MLTDMTVIFYYYHPVTHDGRTQWLSMLCALQTAIKS